MLPKITENYINHPYTQTNKVINILNILEKGKQLVEHIHRNCPSQVLGVRLIAIYFLMLKYRVKQNITTRKHVEQKTSIPFMKRGRGKPDRQSERAALNTQAVLSNSLGFFLRYNQNNG